MEDRYLFKAKFDDSDRWVKGQLVEVNDTYLIIPNHASKILAGWFSTSNIIEVKKDTICQCTGLKDKYGKLIWEKDIIMHNGNYFVVKWNAPCARFDIVLNNSHNIPIGKWEPMICDWKTNDFKEYRKSVDYEVIGNIFDNKELLECEG